MLKNLIELGQLMLEERIELGYQMFEDLIELGELIEQGERIEL